MTRCLQSTPGRPWSFVLVSVRAGQKGFGHRGRSDGSGAEPNGLAPRLAPHRIGARARRDGGTGQPQPRDRRATGNPCLSTSWDLTLRQTAGDHGPDRLAFGEGSGLL